MGRLRRSWTAKQVEAALLPGAPELPSDLLGGGHRLFLLVVTPACRSAALPDHLLSPDFPVGQAYLFTLTFRHVTAPLAWIRHATGPGRPRPGMLRAQLLL